MLWFVVAAQARPRCQTPALLRAERAGSPLRLADRPAEVGFVDSAIYPLRVHYRRTNDEDRARNTVLPAAETAWALEIDQMGWPAPPSDAGAGGDDRYDFYLTNEGTNGGAFTWGVSTDTDPTDGWNSRSTFIALDDRFILDRDMLVFVAHEFNHASQYTIDASELPLVMWEGTAEAVADLVDDANDTYLYEVPYFQGYPFESLLFDGYVLPVIRYEPFSYYEYGAIVFADFLEERYGTKDGTTLLRMWTQAAQPGRGDEPDWLDSLGQMDPGVPSAAALYTEFAVWRMFAGPQDDGAHFEEGALWYDAVPWVEADLSLDAVDGLQVAPTREPYELGTSYWRIDLQGGTVDTLRATADGDPASQWGLAWAVWPAAGGPAVTGFTPATAAQVVAELPLDGGATAMIGVVNGGRPGLEGETPTGDVARQTFTLSFERVPPPPPAHTGGPTGDTGAGPLPPLAHTGGDPHTGAPADGPPAGDATPKGGCGCDGGAGASISPGVLLAAALLRRRRRQGAGAAGSAGSNR